MPKPAWIWQKDKSSNGIRKSIYVRRNPFGNHDWQSQHGWKPKKMDTWLPSQGRWWNCSSNWDYRLPWRRRENIPTASSCAESKPAPAASANDDGKSDDAFDIVVIGGGPTVMLQPLKLLTRWKDLLIQWGEHGCIPADLPSMLKSSKYRSYSKPRYRHQSNFTVDMDKLLETNLRLSILWLVVLQVFFMVTELLFIRNWLNH